MAARSVQRLRSLLRRVLRDTRLPEVQRGAGSHVHRAAANSPAEGVLPLDQALKIYDDGTRAALALHDRQTTSLLVSACCLPGSRWAAGSSEQASSSLEADELLERALALFERTWSADAIDPRARLDGHSGGAEVNLVRPTRPRCSHDACLEAAVYGSAEQGLACSCEQHRAPSEVRVDLHAPALLALAEGCARRGGMQRYAARLLEHDACPEPFDSLAPTAQRDVRLGYVALLRACAGRPSRASTVWEAALAAGVTPSAAMLNALVRSCAQAGDMQAAFRAARRGQRHGLSPDVGTVNALMRGCVVARDKEDAWAVMRLAEELGVPPNDRTHNLLLAAHLAELQRAPKGGGAGGRTEQQLYEAQQLYERGRALGWTWHQSTRRWLLRLCALHDEQMPFVLAMLAEMEERGEDTFAPLDDLMHVMHSSRAIDQEALRLWEQGGAPAPLPLRVSGKEVPE